MYLLPFWWLFSDCFIALFFFSSFVLFPCDLIIVFTVMFVLLSFLNMYIIRDFCPVFVICGCLPGLWIWVCCVSASFPFLLRFLLDIFRSGEEISSDNLYYFLIGSCCTNGCNAGEFKFFLLCYLGLYGL